MCLDLIEVGGYFLHNKLLLLSKQYYYWFQANKKARIQYLLPNSLVMMQRGKDLGPTENGVPYIVKKQGPMREDKTWAISPYIEFSNGRLEWRKGGMIDQRGWHQKGKLHRVDGPALQLPDGTCEWYLDGKLLINGRLHRIFGEVKDQKPYMCAPYSVCYAVNPHEDMDYASIYAQRKKKDNGMSIREALDLCKEIKSYKRLSTLEQVKEHFDGSTAALIIETPWVRNGDKTGPFWKAVTPNAKENGRRHACNLISECSTGLVIRDTMNCSGNSGYHIMPFEDFKYIRKIYRISK